MRLDPARQSIFSIIAPVDRARVAALAAYLQTIDATIASDSGFALASVETLHFCSFTIFPDDRFGPYLVFENNIDGSPRAYIDTICGLTAPLLHAVYAFCTDYTAPNPDPAVLRRYLRAHRVRAHVAFVGNVGRSARRIRAEAELVAEIDAFLDRYAVTPQTTAETILADVRRHLRADAAWDWVWRRAPRLSLTDRAGRWLSVLGVGTAIAAVLPIPLLPTIAFLRGLRRREKTDPISIPGPSAAQLAQLAQREDRIGQNHMASLCYLKPGAFRRRLLKVVLFGANLYARISTNGTLSGLDSLHFAHWSLIDNDTRLLFLTNYDGSWENYLDDFIDKAAIGLTAIWSNTINFPRTKWLVLEGARNERDFKAVARTTQAVTSVWYSAYPALTTTSINNNSAICADLARNERRVDAAAWLRRL